MDRSTVNKIDRQQKVIVMSRAAQVMMFVVVSLGPLLMIIGAIGNNWWVQTNTGNKEGLFRECNDGCRAMKDPSTTEIAIKFFAVLAIVSSVMTLFVFSLNFFGRFCCNRKPPASEAELNHERKRQRTEAILMTATPCVSCLCGILVMVIWIGDHPDDQEGYRYGFDFYFWVFGTFCTVLLFLAFACVRACKVYILGHEIEDDMITTFVAPTGRGAGGGGDTELGVSSSKY